MPIAVAGEEDEVTGDGKGEADEDEGDSALKLVREEGHGHCKGDGGGPRDDGVELGLDRRVSVGLDNGWDEVRESW